MSPESTSKLLLAHPNLQRLFFAVDRIFPCEVICSMRGKIEQDEAFNSGKSKTPWPKSKHNVTPSLAVDVLPNNKSFSWDNVKLFFFFAGVVDAIAKQLNIKVRWGGDWDKDYNFLNEKFVDLPHWEIYE